MDNYNKNWDDWEDNELLIHAQNGNDEAFEEIAKRYYPRLYQTAYVILSSHCEAENATREAFEKAHQSLHSFKGESLLLTWLCRIVIDLACDKYHQLQQCKIDWKIS